jgi:hypothetical protein
MSLGPAELERLESLLDSAELLAIDFLEVASSQSAKALLNISDRRDFVLGAAYGYVISMYAQSSKASLSENETIELLVTVLLGLSRIDPYKLAAYALKNSESFEDLK